ncbi:hypothetical protein B0H13DRAFT_2407849 [Mycena leptocephala]|nr:hypothetical protein B0H13DRAFT_2407849 [Mycena leptocephala]
MFEDHYKAKASTARYCAHRIMGIEDSTGRLTPKELKTLYMARVDYHLIHGCEVPPDSEDKHIKQLCAVQVDVLRQMTNVHSQSMLAPLFTETGIMPLRTRRFMILLGYLRYILSLKLPHFAGARLNSSIELAAAGKKSWTGDVLIAATKLPFGEHPSYWESGPWTGPLDLLMYLSVDRLKCVGLLEEMDHTVDQRCPTMDRVVDLAMDLAIDPLMDLHAKIQRYNHFLFWLPSQDASQQQWASSCMVLIGLSSWFLRLSATTHLALPIKSSAMASSMGGTQAHRGLIVQRWSTIRSMHWSMVHPEVH